MKKIKKLLISFCIMLFLPLFLFACDEKSFDSTPWGSSAKTGIEVTQIVENCREYMMDEVNIPVKYNTTTIFKFFETEDGNFLNKTVKEVTSATFSSANIATATAKIETKTYIDDVLCSLELSTYVRGNDDNGYIYTIKTTYGTEEDEEDIVFMERQATNIGDRTFYTMLGNIIFEAEENEADKVSEKVFNNVHYYKLTSNTLNLENIQAKFAEKTDLFINPELFVINKSGEDYAMPFSYEYGITNLDYINYFSINYSIGNSNMPDGQNFERYLTVSSVTTLEKYGNSVEIATVPENINDFTVATFDNTVKSDEYYVVYNQVIDENNHIKTTTQRESNGNIRVKVEEYNLNTPVNTEYYYLDYEGTSFTAYKINSENRTYMLQESFEMPFLIFNYSFKFFTKTIEGAYQYGSNEAYNLIRMQDGEVYSIADGKSEEATILRILDFNKGETSITLYDLSGLTEVI